jgi:PH/SEC7 domain-containing protein
MYNSIKTQQILQPLGSLSMGRSSTSSLLGGSPSNPLKQRPSLRGGDRVATLKRGSIRGFSSLLGTQQTFSAYSSSGSVDGRVSPAPSFATSQEVSRVA